MYVCFVCCVCIHAYTCDGVHKFVHNAYACRYTILIRFYFHLTASATKSRIFTMYASMFLLIPLCNICKFVITIWYWLEHNKHVFIQIYYWYWSSLVRVVTGRLIGVMSVPGQMSTNSRFCETDTDGYNSHSVSTPCLEIDIAHFSN